MDKDQVEILKASAEGATAGALKSLHDLVSKLAGPAAEEAGLALKDNIRVWRFSRAIRLAKRVNEILENDGGLKKPVALKVLLPSIEYASLEDDDYLQDRWAALLAEASNEHLRESKVPVFIEILKQLTHVDVRLLERCYKLRLGASEYGDLGGFDWLFYSGSEGLHEYHVTDLRLALENILRLGLVDRIEVKPVQRDDVEIMNRTVYKLTRFGHSFVYACQICKHHRFELIEPTDAGYYQCPTCKNSFTNDEIRDIKRFLRGETLE